MLPQYQILASKRRLSGSVRIQFGKFSLIVVCLPLCSLSFCLIWSLLFYFQRATATHCNVRNFLPSISAVIGNYEVQRLVWQSAICIHICPRLMVTKMYFEHNMNLVDRNGIIIAKLIAIANVIEITSLLGLTLWTSVDNYTFHKVSFTAFVITSEIYMLLSYVLNIYYRRSRVLTRLEETSLKVKKKMLLLNVVCFAGAVGCFVRHNAYCEAGVYTVFAFLEYIVVMSNMGFHMTAYWDFYDKSGLKLLNGFKIFNRFEKGPGAQLPEAYKKFWKEWKVQKPTGLDNIGKKGKWKIDPVTSQVKLEQFVPIPTILPRECNDGVFGEAAVIKGFQKRKPHVRRVPHFWVPVLRRSVVLSVILNRHISLTLTDDTMNLIHDSKGFDHYVCKTPACDLQSILAIRIKRNILQTLQQGCPTLNSDTARQMRVLSEYSPYLDKYTPEEIDWYGLTYDEAIEKLKTDISNRERPLPLKFHLREKLIRQLMESQDG